MKTKQKLQDLLISYINIIQVENTKGAERIVVDNIYEQSFYDNLFLKTNLSYENISASFIYLDWPIHFDITPKKGDKLEPSSYRREFPFNLIPAVETNHYEFFYDVAYPVVVELRDDTALNGEGFSLLLDFGSNFGACGRRTNIGRNYLR